MSQLRYSEGGISISVDGLDERLREILQATIGATGQEMQRVAQLRVDRARAEWYGPGGVTRRTGKSGDLEVITTITPTEVRVGIGSRDDRRVGSRQVAMTVHRPGRLSLVPKLVTRDEWWGWKKRGQPVGKSGTPNGADWTIYEPNPEASDGKNLMSELVMKPLKADVRTLPTTLREAILRRANA